MRAGHPAQRIDVGGERCRRHGAPITVAAEPRLHRIDEIKGVVAYDDGHLGGADVDSVAEGPGRWSLKRVEWLGSVAGQTVQPVALERDRIHPARHLPKVLFGRPHATLQLVMSLRRKCQTAAEVTTTA